MTAASEREAKAKQDIAEVLVRYASGIDRRDWDLFRSCFAAECRVDYGEIGAWHSAEAITEFMIRSHADLGHTLHRMSNLAITVDGGRAHAQSYVDGILMAADGRSGLHPIGFYEDQLVQVGGRWEIVSRRFTMVHLGAIGAP